jgi:hypothetical protein
MHPYRKLTSSKSETIQKSGETSVLGGGEFSALRSGRSVPNAD